jgi:2-desacetyl-2-hydroxyethyl bacteriochlorophyllide A dehydrogenase
MKAALLTRPGELGMIDRPDPDAPGAGEALVRIERVGVCGTDLHAFNGRQPLFSYPRVLGHELGVTVEAIGEGVTGVAVGDRCAVEPYLNCGRCIACRRGKTNCCESLRVLGVHVDGGMTERIVVPADKLHRSDKLSLDQLALVETLGIGAHAVARAAIEPGEFALVIGAGPIGLGAIAFAKAAGAKVIVLDLDEKRLAFCREQMGIEWAIDSVGEDAGALRAICGGDLPTAVFDATGNAQSMAGTFDLVAPGGRIAFIGLFIGEVSFDDPNFHRREITLLASRNALPSDFRHIISQLEAGKIDLDPWITDRAPLEAVPARLAEWAKPGSGQIKAMIEIA